MKNLQHQLIILLFFSVVLTAQTPTSLTADTPGFFPEDIFIIDNIAYVSGLGDGTVRTFNLNLANPTPELFAAAEDGYGQAWGLKSDGTTLLSLLNNANFAGGESGPAKLVAYDIATKQKTGEWDLPAGAIGHTVSIVDGKYYVTDFGTPRIFEVDPVAGTVDDSWFTSAEWDPTISGIGGTIYDNEGGFYVSQGNKLWYLPISGGAPGTLQEVTVAGLDAVDADGISWDDANNTLYYATNDAGDPNDVGTAYELVFSDATNATGSIIASGFDDSSGLWYKEEDNGEANVFVLESQFGVLFGLDTFVPPFNIAIIPIRNATSTENVLAATTQVKVSPNPFVQTTNFEINLSRRGEFQFQIFDMNGREVSRNKVDLLEGVNTFTFDGSHLTRGIYTYRLSNQRGFVSGKMVLMQ